MKYFFIFLVIINLSSCNPNDCFESTGKIIQKEIVVATFNKIEVGNEVSLIIKQGATQKVIIETGENLIADVTVEVIDGKLFMKDENSCNLTRDYAVTKIYVTSPNIKEIRSNTSRTIKSDGVLNFDELILNSEDYNQDALNIGDFDLQINSKIVHVTSNGNSIFNINGQVENLIVGFYSGSCRFNGSNLISKKIHIKQKSTNDILVFPVEEIKGDIYSIGDVISYNHPNLIEITEHYSGKLIFK